MDLMPGVGFMAFSSFKKKLSQKLIRKRRHQCGKSIVMDTIEKALKAKFGARVSDYE